MSATPRSGRRRLGQHFLRSRRVIERILSVLDPKASDAFIEIGPGDGALTAPLLATGARVDAVELDGRLVSELRQRHGANGRLRIHHADALRCDFERLGDADDAVRVVGNLPYYLTTPLLFRLFALARPLRDMHFMVQRELATRLVASPGNRDWGRLGVMCRCHVAARALFNVPPGAFSPPPRVVSTFVRLTPHAVAPARIADPARFDEVVRRAFGQRRKMLRRALTGMVSADELAALGIADTFRAESLDLAAFAEISNWIHARDAAAKPDAPERRA